MASNTERLVAMFELLSEREQLLVTELISHLLPDDIATPADLEAIEKSEIEFERGETVSENDIDWH